MLTRFMRLFLLWRSLARDPKTPLTSKVLPWAALLYFLVPIDILPDVVPLLGQLDDISIIVLLVTIALNVIPKDLWNEHVKTSTRTSLSDERKTDDTNQ